MRQSFGPYRVGHTCCYATGLYELAESSTSFWTLATANSGVRVGVRWSSEFGVVLRFCMKVLELTCVRGTCRGVVKALGVGSFIF